MYRNVSLKMVKLFPKYYVAYFGLCKFFNNRYLFSNDAVFLGHPVVTWLCLQFSNLFPWSSFYAFVQLEREHETSTMVFGDKSNMVSIRNKETMSMFNTFVSSKNVLHIQYKMYKEPQKCTGLFFLYNWMFVCLFSDPKLGAGIIGSQGESQGLCILPSL